MGSVLPMAPPGRVPDMVCFRSMCRPGWRPALRPQFAGQRFLVLGAPLIFGDVVAEHSVDVVLPRQRQAFAVEFLDERLAAQAGAQLSFRRAIQGL